MTPSLGKSSGTTVRSAAIRIGAAVLLLGANGCGLSEYEEQIDREQKRLQLIDEENKLLGEPIEAPKIKETNSTVFQISATTLFFRPPRGIGAKPGPAPRGELLHPYAALSRGAPWQRRNTSEETPFLDV
ncbi:hypothetical protein, partial [Pseudomonas aeruginosa]|uniref:hypothetical protein n=1 Tax=Pseudomonas aeruginosa TaxID=287 RepID=UPI0011BEBBC7